MADDRISVILRRMAFSDVDQVALIDRLSFPTPWPPRTYRYEITNDRSCMFVLEHGIQPSAFPENGGSLFRRLRQIVAPAPSPPLCNLLGFSGLWHIADEAHISTIAVHPDWRGKKLGELLLWSMVRQGIRQGANQVTLEVRVGNTVAQNLYRKYGFEVNRRRRGYYRDNGEDAYEMVLTPLNAAYHARLAELGRSLAWHLKIEDRT